MTQPSDNRPIRIGEILVEQGVLSDQQVFEIIQAQKKLHLPFGVLAERMFEVTLESIENAWIEQYHRFTGTIDLTQQSFDDRALRMINRRQAWQFECLPVSFEPTSASHICQPYLARSSRSACCTSSPSMSSASAACQSPRSLPRTSHSASSARELLRRRLTLPASPAEKM